MALDVRPLVARLSVIDIRETADEFLQSQRVGVLCLPIEDHRGSGRRYLWSRSCLSFEVVRTLGRTQTAADALQIVGGEDLGAHPSEAILDLAGRLWVPNRPTATARD